MRVSERASAHFAILSLHFRSVSARSLLLSSTLPRQFSISAMSQQCMQKRVCDSLAPPSLRPSILWIFNNRSSTNTQAHSDCSAATAYRKVVIKTSSFFKSSQLPRFLGHSPNPIPHPSLLPRCYAHNDHQPRKAARRAATAMSGGQTLSLRWEGKDKLNGLC